MVALIKKADSVARAADITAEDSTAFRSTAAISGVDTVAMMVLWAELAEIARFGEAAKHVLMLAKPYATQPGAYAQRYQTAACFTSGGSFSMGPLKLVGLGIGSATADTNSYTRASAYINTGAIQRGTATALEIVKSTNEPITRQAGNAEILFGALMLSLHYMLDNTIAVYENLYKQVQRSPVPVIDDPLTMARLNSLFSGSVQKVIQQWGQSTLVYDGTALSSLEMAQCEAIATALTPSLMAAVTPRITAAVRKNTTPLLQPVT